MTSFHPIQARGAQHKAVFQSNFDNLKNTGELLTNLFDGDWESVKQDVSEYKVPLWEGTKAYVENIVKEEDA